MSGITGTSFIEHVCVDVSGANQEPLTNGWERSRQRIRALIQSWGIGNVPAGWTATSLRQGSLFHVCDGRWCTAGVIAVNGVAAFIRALFVVSGGISFQIMWRFHRFKGFALRRYFPDFTGAMSCQRQGRSGRSKKRTNFFELSIQMGKVVEKPCRILVK